MSDVAEDQVERLERLRRMYEKRIDAQDVEHPGYATAWAVLRERLLQLGGKAVVPPGRPDPMIGILTAEGAEVAPKAVETVQGTRSDCHANVVDLWRSGRLVALGTGYGLNGDLWREHSWGWASDGRIVETTESREIYFGLRMAGDRAEWFADWIDPPQG
jgi:hypothetical protein